MEFLVGVDSGDFLERIGEGTKMALVVVVGFSVYIEGLSRTRTTFFSPILSSSLRGPCPKRVPTHH